MSGPFIIPHPCKGEAVCQNTHTHHINLILFKNTTMNTPQKPKNRKTEQKYGQLTGNFSRVNKDLCGLYIYFT